MSLPLSREVQAVYRRADELAGIPQKEMSTGHVLLALFEVPNRAAKLLRDRSVTPERVAGQLRGMDPEPPHLMMRVRRRSRRLASGSRSEVVSSLHLLAALIRESAGHARTLLEACNVDVGAVRTAVMSQTTSTPGSQSRGGDDGGEPQSRPRRTRRSGRSSSSTSTRSGRTTGNIGFHPSLGVEPRTPNEVADRQSPSISDAEVDPPLESPSADSDEIERCRSSETPLDLDHHPGINRGGRPRGAPGGEPADEKAPSIEESEPDDSHRAEALEDARRTTRELAERLFNDVGDSRRHTRPPDATDDPAADPDLAAEYRLDEDRYPNLTEYGRNLTVEAALGKIDAVIGRDEEIARLIDILGKRRANNPLLVGEPGVGKTAIVEGLAKRLVEMARGDETADRRRIVELEMGRLLSGTHLRGAFSERLLGIKDEVAEAGGEIIVFLDEIHMWISAGQGGDGGDAAGELKTALARGRFPCIGATTHDECRKFVEADPAFERRFQRVTVDEPDEETALKIVDGVRGHYERHHGVTYTSEALEASVRLGSRYIHDRQLPDKSIGVLDLAGSRAARRGEETVDRQILAEVVADMAAIPPERLTGSDADRFLHMESFLSESIVGHDDIVSTIAELLRRNYAGFRSDRPIGSLLFLGPTGVGKTEMVKVLADFLFHDRDAVVQLDMSEYMESHSVSRLIGSPPGYVGYDQGGQLTETIRRRPYQVVLLDEIEKAHRDVLNLLLQLFDEGRLTDGRGREVDFSNALVVMTSNLGAEVFEKSEQPRSSIGFSRAESPEAKRRRDQKRLRSEVLEESREHFTPELWNRIDERLVFLPLSREDVAQIAELQLAESQKRLSDESDIRMEYEPEVIDHLIEHGGYNRRLGARPMRQTIQRLVEGEVARAILAGRIGDGDTARVRVERGQIIVDRE